MVQTHVGSPHRISLGRPSSRGRDPTLEQGQGMTMKERRRQKCHGLTAGPMPFPCAARGKGEVEELGMKERS